MLSVRHKGRSIPDLSGEIVSPLARLLFMIFVWIAILLVIVVFGITAANTLVGTPEIVVPVFCLIIIAIIFGLLVNKLGWNFWASTAICMGLTVISFIAGYYFPLTLPLTPNTAIIPIIVPINRGIRIAVRR